MSVRFVVDACCAGQWVEQIDTNMNSARLRIGRSQGRAIVGTQWKDGLPRVGAECHLNWEVPYHG